MGQHFNVLVDSIGNEMAGCLVCEKVGLHWFWEYPTKLFLLLTWKIWIIVKWTKINLLLLFAVHAVLSVCLSKHCYIQTAGGKIKNPSLKYNKITVKHTSCSLIVCLRNRNYHASIKLNRNNLRTNNAIHKVVNQSVVMFDPECVCAACTYIKIYAFSIII